MNRHTVEIWAQLLLSAPDRARIVDFFAVEFSIKKRYIVGHMHITIYHARRPIPNLAPTIEAANVVVPAEETRFMVLAPGGENPRPNLDPANRKVGIRVHRQSISTPAIRSYRSRLTAHENERILGSREPSNNQRNAFGARHFQPHMSILRPGSGIGRDLTVVGDKFRNLIGDLTFDQFVIDVSHKQHEA